MNLKITLASASIILRNWKRFLIAICLLVGFLGVFIPQLVNAKNQPTSNELIQEFSSGQTIKTTVTKITDGDTIRISSIKWNSLPVRFACINTPESRSYGKRKVSESEKQLGKQSKEALSKLISVGTPVTIRISPQVADSNKRLVAEVFRRNESESVNLKMVRQGNAIVYCKYLSNCQTSQAAYLKAEKAAKDSSLGVWKATANWSQAKKSAGCS